MNWSTLFFLTLFSLSLISCNSKESISTISNTSPDNVTTEPSVTLKSLSLFWGTDDPSTAELKLAGDAQHHLDPTKFKNTKLSFGGVIKSTPQSRDIVLLIDVSGSMGPHRTRSGYDMLGSDPLTNGSCARLEAVRTLMNKAKAQGPSRFSVVTFSGFEQFNSNGFFSSLEEMFPEDNAAETLCAASGGTNFSAPLKSAIRNFKDFPSAALREVYLVSDGEPADYQNEYGRNISCDMSKSYCNGQPEAYELKHANVILGTLMLGNQLAGSNYLKNNIAGMGPTRVPLHANALNAAKLNDALSSLILDPIVSGVISYKGINQTDWTQINMIGISRNGQFRSLEISFDSELFPAGLEVRFNYSTARGHNHQGIADLVWAN